VAHTEVSAQQAVYQLTMSTFIRRPDPVVAADRDHHQAERIYVVALTGRLAPAGAETELV
jgi:hypothetical protein